MLKMGWVQERQHFYRTDPVVQEAEMDGLAV
jgi:hypothetical protein